ncbi:hypothetical protein [Pyxidicoccus xibeiensis]|uniref:hypothetical protein n=1 Tax=Pyxidicoccus xibeiensis TaxID=2906759 RepID=UPI0020A7B0E4|nr:hypothetical protein [Pyxidicoccus xibeiensis]MCP3139004.1 hypothetical protein [Pyxidicoccus xibeiensis]
MQVSARTLALGALLLASSACSPEGGALEGSVAPLLDLRYERVEAQWAPGELAINFVTAQGSGINTVLKVSALVGDMIPEGYTGPLDIDLAQVLEDGAQRGAIGRSVLDEPARTFPQLERGGLQVDGTPVEAGSRITGDFHVTFVNGTDVYSGRTIFGSFEATVQQ